MIPSRRSRRLCDKIDTYDSANYPLLLLAHVGNTIARKNLRRSPSDGLPQAGADRYR